MSIADRAAIEGALRVCDAALAANPDDFIARHNRAVELRRLDRPDEAFDEVERALRGGMAAPETALIRAHLLADLGRYAAAIDAYRALLDGYPDLIDAHETLSKLLPQVGRGDEALDSYRRALVRLPQSGLLWLSALGAAKNLRDAAQLLDWARQVEQRFGPDTLVAGLRAQALSWQGNDAAALDLLHRAVAVDPAHQPLHTTIAHVALKSGDPATARAAAMQAAQLAPEDQTAWALLSVALRLLGDPREHWLTDYDSHIGIVDLDGLDLPRIADALTCLHTTTAHPAEQSLRGGTQTRGDLFDKTTPEICDLRCEIDRAVTSFVGALPENPQHPFLRRNTRAVHYAGSWSVRLQSNGFHINHIHPAGWLSSACYIDLPPGVGQGDDTGALAFGMPDAELGLDLLPRRIVRPKVGQLVLFPSYFWHGTIPFESTMPRLTVAFDALPAIV